MNTIKTLENMKNRTQITDNVDYATYYELERPAPLVRICTSVEAKPEGDFNWFYYIRSDEDYFYDSRRNTEFAFGHIDLCKCVECQSFGNDRNWR